MRSRYDVAIIGGGASGMIAAIIAARSNPSLKIALLEKNARVGKKLLATGNGRCNLTNLDQDINHYHGKNVWFIQQILQQFDLDETLSFFKSIGVEVLVENGKVYPYSLQASSVLDLLRHALSSHQVEEVCEFPCTSVEKAGEEFQIHTSDGRVVCASSVLVATGGKASPQTGSAGDGYDILSQFGHKKTPVFPALVQVCVPSKKTLPLKGIKVQSNVRVFTNGQLMGEDSGEVLFTDYGLSGPPVFQLSRFASITNVGVDFVLDLFPAESLDNLSDLLAERSKLLSKDMLLVGLLHKTIAREVLREYANSSFNFRELAQLLKNWKFSVRGTRGWTQAQVTCGGLELNDFSPLTLESKKVKGLYACGEILDADGDCGGYNLQWAWSSGAVAGCAISRR